MVQKKTNFAGASANSGTPGVEVRQTMNGIKPGVKTSEFWVTVVVQVLNLFKMFFPDADFDPSGSGTLAVNGLAAVYVLGRSIIKAMSEKASGSGRVRVPVATGTAVAVIWIVLFTGLAGCSGNQSGVTKAFNTLSAVQSGYNAAGPILESANIPEDKKAAVEAADKFLHDAIASGWAALAEYKSGESDEDHVKVAFNTILAGLEEFGKSVDNETFRAVVKAIRTALEFYLDIKVSDADLLREFQDSLNKLEARVAYDSYDVPQANEWITLCAEIDEQGQTMNCSWRTNGN